ncbi:MAG: DUF4203 domain-containing protein [Thermomicrobiales bacterium]|jgi:hypothetical protein
MEQVIIGILLALVGLGVCFFGLRYWFILLPIFGAITGFFIGARVVQEVFGTGFLSTGVSWIVGIIVGLVFALLSWFVWYAGAIIMAGAVGASLFSGILHAIFTNPWGIALFIVALIGAVLFAAIALFLNLPIYIVIVNSALGGAALAVAGVLVLIGNIAVQELSTGATVAVADEVRFQGAGIFWYIIWIVLAIVGMLFQVQSISSVTLPEDKWVPARAD